MKSNIQISIVVPVYSSADILPKFFNEVKSALKNHIYELILINDCSPDNSWKVIQELCNTNSDVIGINLRKNSGQDCAIMAGLNHVSGDYIVIMDDDLQHDPHDIPALYEECKKGYDVCYANFNYEKKKQAWWKNMGSWLNGKIAEFLIEKPKDVYLSPFEIIHSSVITEVVKYTGPYPYIQALILNVTRNVTQIDIKHHNRYSGESHFSLIKSMAVFFRLATGYSIKPLRFITLFGTIFALIGFILLFIYIIQYFLGYGVVEGWTTIVVLLLLIGGLILISLGIIGEYIGRMYINFNNKPQYVISKLINYED